MADNVVEVKIAVDAAQVKPGADQAATDLDGAARKIRESIGSMDAQVSAQMSEMMAVVKGSPIQPDTSGAVKSAADVQALGASVRAAAGTGAALAGGLQIANDGATQLSGTSSAADSAMSGMASAMSAVSGASAASALHDTAGAADSVAASAAKAGAATDKLAGKIKDTPAPPKEAAEGVKGLTESLKGGVGAAEGMFKSMTSAMGAVSGLLAVVAAGGALKGMISAANEWNSEVGGLARSLGVTTEAASSYAVAARMAGVDSETLTKATSKLTEVIAQGGPQLGALGVKARDASGAIRPMGEVLSDTMTKISEIKNPSEQAAAGIRIFGGEWAQMSGVMKMSAGGLEEAKKKAEALGLVVGPDAAAASKEYKQNLKEIGLVGQSLSVQLGNMLLPAVAEVGKFIATNGPVIAEGFKMALGAVGPIFSATVDVLRGAFDAAKTIISAVVDAVSGAFSALGKTMATFTNALGITDGATTSSVSGMQLLKNVIGIIQAAFIAAGAAIKATLVTISGEIAVLADMAGAVSKSIQAVLQMDFEGAKAAWSDFYESAAKRGQEGAEKLKAIAAKGAEDVQKALMTEEPAPKKVSAPKESGGPVKKAVSMADLDARLAAEKLAYAKSQEQAGTYYAYSQTQELAYWESKKSTFEVGSQDRITLEKKLLDMRNAIQVTANAQEKQAAQVRADALAASDTSQLDVAIASAKAQFDMGRMSSDQLADVTIAGEQRRTEIVRDGLEARIALMQKDPNRNPAEIAAGMRAIQDLETSQAAKIQAIRDAAAKAALDKERALADARLSAHEAATTAQLEASITAQAKELEGVKASKSEILKAERDAEQKRLDNALAFANARIALLQEKGDGGADQTAAIEAEEAKKLAIMQASAEKIKALNAQLKAESPWSAIADEMGGSMGKAVQGVQDKTMTLREAENAIWADMKASFIKHMVMEPLQQMAMRAVRETAIYQMLAGSQVAAQTVASTTVTGVKAAESATIVGANAVEAGSGAAASQAAIPIVGPALAVAAMLALVAKVRNLKSARGGFDIGDEEPLTQLHAREMVLPRQHADTIRGMGDAPDMIGSAVTKMEQITEQIKTAISVVIKPMGQAMAGAVGAAGIGMAGATGAMGQAGEIASPPPIIQNVNMAPPSLTAVNRQAEQRQQAAADAQAQQPSRANANTDRALTSQSSAGDTYQISINALDGADVKRVLINNTPALAAALKSAKRNGDL